VELVFCGGAGEVGASCYLLSVDGKNVLFDSGIRMDSTQDKLPDFRIIQEKGGLDAIFISHAHLDHTGALPLISREYPNASIYMTHATKDLVRVLLYDSLKVMGQQEGEIPIYAEVHVEHMLNRILCFSPEYTIRPFNDSDIKVTFYHAGHIAGGSSIFLQSGEGSVFYSGDISLTNQFTVGGAVIPKLRPDIAVIESTYGDKLHANRQTEEERLARMVGEVIEEGGKVLIPAFALGRAQEVILILKRAMNRNKLPRFKVFVDGMVREICRMYRLNPNYLRSSLAKRIWRNIDIFFDEWIQPVTNRTMREAVIEDSDPCCIISSSGMLTGGPSQWYAEKLAGDRKNFIAITGYQDEEAPGRRLLDLLDLPVEDRFLQLGDKQVPVRCRVESYSLSAHADKTQLIGLVHNLSPRQVFLVHGQEEIMTVLGKDLQADYWGRVYLPANGESYNIRLKRQRKQLERPAIPSLGKESFPEEPDLGELWKHILKHDSKKRSFTVEELFSIWHGGRTPELQQISRLAQLLQDSDYFEPDNRRPFLYNPLSRQEVDQRRQEKEGPMEVNRMLALLEEFFPPETGLYKKGARFDEKIALLYFNFPKAAGKAYEDRLREFEAVTGWKTEINQECNLEAAEDLLISLLPQGTYLSGKLSYYRLQGYFKASIEGDVDHESIKQRFLESTGLELILNDEEKAEPAAPVSAQPGQMEQNKVFKLIDEVFTGKPHRLYRKGLKKDETGSYVELSFVSPEIGAQYGDVIEQLEKITGWAMKINPNPNQNEIIKLARRLMEGNGLRLKRNPGFYQMEKAVRVIPAEEWDENIFESLKHEFYRQTGYNLLKD
jgi:Cft2 family RNA processing exonuclease